MSEEINENEHEEELHGQEERSDMLHEQTDPLETITKVTGMYKEWFLDYASYVILERAVPSLEDGLKPSVGDLPLKILFMCTSIFRRCNFSTQ